MKTKFFCTKRKLFFFVSLRKGTALRKHTRSDVGIVWRVLAFLCLFLWVQCTRNSCDYESHAKSVSCNTCTMLEVVLESSSILLDRLYHVANKYFTRFLICVHSSLYQVKQFLFILAPLPSTDRTPSDPTSKWATSKQCTMPENCMTLFTNVPRKVIFGSFTQSHDP